MGRSGRAPRQGRVLVAADAAWRPDGRSGPTAGAASRVPAGVASIDPPAASRRCQRRGGCRRGDVRGRRRRGRLDTATDGAQGAARRCSGGRRALGEARAAHHPRRRSTAASWRLRSVGICGRRRWAGTSAAAAPASGLVATLQAKRRLCHTMGPRATGRPRHNPSTTGESSKPMPDPSAARRPGSLWRNHARVDL